MEHPVEQSTLQERDQRGRGAPPGCRSRRRASRRRRPSANPRELSITSTRLVTRVRVGAGDDDRPLVRSRQHAGRRRACCAASRRKSSSSTIVSANSSTSAGGLARAATGMRPTRKGAIEAHGGQVVAHERGTSGRCTLTTTSSPVCSTRRWTWAIEAAAIGVAVELGEVVLERSGRAPPRRCGARRRTAPPAPGRAAAGTRPPAPRGRCPPPRRGSGRA